MLISDLGCTGYKAILYTIEKGCRGLIDKENKETLKSILTKCKFSGKFKEFILELSKSAILGSFEIFTSRKERNWNEYNLIGL